MKRPLSSSAALLSGLTLSLLTLFTSTALAQKPHPRLSPLAIEGMRGAFAWRDIKVGRRALRMILERAPQLSRINSAARVLESISWGGFKPWRGESAGLDPQRGVTLFWGDQGAMRLLIAHKPGASKEAFREVRSIINRGLDLDWEVSLSSQPLSTLPTALTPTAPTPTGEARSDSVAIGSTAVPKYVKPAPRLICRSLSELNHWLVCDTPQVKSGPAPYWLTAEMDRGAFWLFMHAPSMLPEPLVLPWESVELHADLSGDELKFSINLNAGFNPLLEMFKPHDELSEVTSWVHESSPLAFKVSLDPRVIEHAGALASQRAWLSQAQQLVDAGWAGEALLTFDGGFDHPVLALSLAPHPWSVDKLSELLCELIGGRPLSREEITADREVDHAEALSWWVIDAEPYRAQPLPRSGWRIPVLTSEESLIIGLFPADVKRRGSPRFQPHEAPISLDLERIGMSGGFIDPLMFELGGLTKDRIPLSTLNAVWSQLISEGGEGLVDIPKPLAGEANSLANSLKRRAQLESSPLIDLFTELTRDEEMFLAVSDLASLALQLIDAIQWTAYSYTQARSGGSGLALEISLSIL